MFVISVTTCTVNVDCLQDAVQLAASSAGEMMRVRWRSPGCITAVSLISLLVIITLFIIRGRVHVIMSYTPSTPTSTWTSTTAATEALSSTTRPPTPPIPIEVASRTLRLDIADAAALLRRLRPADSEDLSDDDVLRRVSKQLNQALRAFQQGRCHIRGVDFTDTGAWCQRAVDSLHIIDRRLADTLANFLYGSTVLSLGDGTGVYRQLILNTSKVSLPR